MPNLYIIAGPNGAGKSLFSSTLVNVDYEVFDGDKHITELRSLYPEISSDILQNSVNENQFREAKNLAIQQRGNFAFETNLSANDPTLSLKEFKAAGYDCHLIFMGVATIEECILRVLYRVKNGGHKVSEESIKYNFSHGYKNLYLYYNLFDSITLLDSDIPDMEILKIPATITIWKGGNYKLFSEHIPDWVKRFIAHLDK